MAGIDLNLSGAVRRTNKGSVDFYYGGGDEAWADLAAAYAGIPSVIRNGKVFGVITAGVISEFWWNDASQLANGDEVPYAQGGTTLTPDQVDAIDNANSPNSGNPFATMADIVSGTTYQGVWNANTNTPTLTSSVGTQGYYYVVNVDGTTDLNGITDWKSRDWAIFNGGTWQKVDNTENPLSIDITNANLITAITNSAIQIGVKYRVTNAIGGVVWIWGIDANVVSRFAVREGDWDGTNYVQGLAGTYSVSTNTFTEQGRIATTPTVNEDTLHGYYVGQQLITIDTGATYVCTDATTGSAVWVVSGIVRIVATNLYIGVNNTGNTVDGDSSNNVFNDYADANILVASVNNIFGFNSQNSNLDNSNNNTFARGNNGHTLLNTEYCIFGEFCSAIECESGNQVIIANYCTALKLLNTTFSFFEDNVTNLDNTTFVGAAFSYCTVTKGLDFATVDFSNATQLFGRPEYWSINKILGTDLIEVTFDANLATSQTGQYDTSADTFIPYGGTYTPTLTPDGAVCTAAALAADAIYSVSNGVMKLMIPIDCTFDFTSNGATIDYTLPFGSIASSGGNVTFNLNPNSPSLPISGYEKNGVIVVTTKDTAFNDDLTIYATITIKLA